MDGASARSVECPAMSARKYDLVFVGGGLAAMMLLKNLLPARPGRVAVVDPVPLPERPPVHWSYWSERQTPYDGFAIGVWRRARVEDLPPQPIAPFALRLVRSTDVFNHLAGEMEGAPVEWLNTAACSISPLANGLYEVVTGSGTVHARWVFDSVPDLEPVFPSPHRPRATLSGTGLRLTADRPVFDPATATLFDPIDERQFAYLLPLSSGEALLESASFGPAVRKEEREPLLRYLRERYPRTRFTVTHTERGYIPLGFAPSRTTGPRHILIGTKRGLVKPSAGYGVVRIARESEHLARLWRENRPLPPVWRAPLRWRVLDTGFLQLAAEDPGLPLALLQGVMGAVPLDRSLRFIDEDLSPGELVPLVRAALPVVLRRLYGRAK